MTKRGSSFGMRVVLYLGGELAQDIFVRGSVYIFFFRDVVSILCLFLFSLFSYSILLYTGLVTIYLWHTLYLFLIYIYIYIWCMLVFNYLSICCFFSLFIQMFLYVCNPLFLFHTKMPWWVLFKVFQKDRFWESIMPWTFFLQSFSRVYVRVRFYCI